MQKLHLRDILANLNLLQPDQIQHFFSQPSAEDAGDSELADLLLRSNMLKKEQIVPVFEYLFETDYLDLSDYEVHAVALKSVPEEFARKHRLIPVNTMNNRIQVVMADPMDIFAQDEVRRLSGLELDIFWAFQSEIEWSIDARYTSASEVAVQAVEDLRAQESMYTELDAESAEDEAEVQRAPIVRLINSILEQSIRERASDIHIEPLEGFVKIRIRVDGDLKEIMTAPKSSHSAIVARIKIMSGLDIAEKRLPQDGRIQINIMNKPYDLRISIMPGIYGEKVVMRVLDKSSVMLTKDQLGFTAHNSVLFEESLKAPEGIVLLSGPTGSGKTTTLYAALNEVNKPNINIVTVEDPVEYRLEGIHQMQVNTRAGLTFAEGLRSILRQDPDVIMIGEIRDSETAEIAVRASITGHLVLSTIHTNDTVSTISRLVDMGIEVYLVASAVNAVVAQRLVKRVCNTCRYEREATQEELATLHLKGPVMVSEGRGCNACGGSGYRGRIAIHEVLVMDKELRAMVVQGISADKIKDRAREKGLKTLRESCHELVTGGVTTVAEMLRATYSVDEQ